MPDFSPNLNLPFLLASQTQKHVTVNENLLKIDNLVMLAVKSRSISTAPSAPNEGDRYIVGNVPTGEWAGKSNFIASYNNLGWSYSQAKNGFVAYCIDETQFLFFDGNIWSSFPISPSNFQNISQIGIGTNSDNNNPISAKINSALFSAKYISEGGSGNLRYIINKEAIDKTGSFIFQNNWSGRAEIGLIGGENFIFKVSPDGTNWKDAINIDKSNARISLYDGINIPVALDGKNEILRQGSTSLFHTNKAVGTDGYNIFIGINAGNFTMSGALGDCSYNIGIGLNCLKSISNGRQNTAIGSGAMYYNSTGNYNSAIGYYALLNNVSGSFNASIGLNSLAENISGNYNSAFGVGALRYKVDGSLNTAFSNCTGIGYDARVSASNQVQLGGTGTTCYAYGAIQDRSDERDKADIRDTMLGLDFINRLRPVDFKWDMRDDYYETIVKKDKKGAEKQELVKRNKDGSKKRNRFHHGLIAQEVEQILKDMQIDFGGFQDHSLNGGCDIKSIGYSELIAPLIKAVQELSAKISQIDAKIG